MTVTFLTLKHLFRWQIKKDFDMYTFEGQLNIAKRGLLLRIIAKFTGFP